MRQANGFTLIEVMIVVVVVAILSAIAYPSYTGHMRRAQVQEAFSALTQFRMRMEQYYQDNRTYASTVDPTICGVPVPAPENPRFIYTGVAPSGCALNTTIGAAAGQSYTMTAVGNGGWVNGFVFDINELNVRRTVNVPTDWGAVAVPVTRWLEKRP